MANLLWWRVTSRSGVEVNLRRYLTVTVTVTLPALLAATAVLTVQSVALSA